MALLYFYKIFKMFFSLYYMKIDPMYLNNWLHDFNTHWLVGCI